MKTEEIIERLRKIAVEDKDDIVALHEAIDILEKTSTQENDTYNTLTNAFERFGEETPELAMEKSIVLTQSAIAANLGAIVDRLDILNESINLLTGVIENDCKM